MNRKRFKTYDRVMPRVFNSSRSSLRSNSVVKQHEVPSSVRTLGGKASGSNLSCSGFSELPIVLDQYVEEESPKKSEPSRRSKVLKPRKTIRSLDTSKSPPRAVTKAVVSSRSLEAQQSTPVLSREEQWSDAHYRKCLSSRSHIRLRELKDEIRAYRETEKLMRLRSKLYKKCGVVFDENGYIASDKAVQAEVQIEKEPENIRRNLWLRLIDREDVNNKGSTYLRVCEAHFENSSLLKTSNRTLLKKGSNPKLLLPLQKYEHKETQATVETNESCTQYEKKQCDSNSQTAANTPRKRKLRNDSLECRKRLKTTTAPETDINSFHILCDKLLTENLSKIVKEQAKLKCLSSGNRYSTDYKIFCLKLFYTSPQAYNLLSECLLNMPSKTTLKRMYMAINTKLNCHIMEVLKTKANSMTDMERNCSLVIDSMSLKANLFYNIKEDKIYGFHEINGIQSPEPAKYALVAMIHGIFINYKQPVGFALLSECKNYEDISKWIDKLIKKLFEIGLKIRVLVSDMGSDFRSSAKERSVTTETPYFFVDSKKIFYIFDAPDLMKSVRNNLMNYNFHFDDCVAKWDHIIQFYEKDKTQQVRSAPKLTESHIKPNNFERMKVKLAVQVLSATVAAGLSTCRDSGAIDSTAEGTIKLIRNINNLFDFLNSSIRFGSTEYQHAFSGTVLQTSFLNEMMKFFATLKLISPKTGKDATPKVKFLEGFQITLKSILLLFEDLKSEGYAYIMTRRLNQDYLEMFFDRVRTRNGNSTEPTSWQFVSAFRKFFFISIIKHSEQGNCSDDLSDILLEGNNLYTSLASDKKQSTSSKQLTNVPEVSQQGEINCNPQISSADYNKFDLPEKNALVYTCSYLLKKCFDQHKDCSLLKSYLSVANSASNLSEDTTFICYEDYCKDGGSTLLIIPQDNFVEFVEAMEEKFASRKRVNCKVLKNLLEEVQNISFSMPCTCFPIIYLKKLYLRMRIFDTLRYNNRAFKQCRNRRKLFSVGNL